MVASQIAATTGNLNPQGLKAVASLVTAPMTAQRAAAEASSMLQDLTTALQSANGQISHAPEDQPTTARRKRAGQSDLHITTHVVQIQEASVSLLLVRTALGNLALQELTDHLLIDHTQTETHQTAAEEATTVQIVLLVLTLTVLGNLVHLAPTEILLIEALAATIVPTDQHVQTQTVRGNPALQDPIVPSAPVTHGVLHLVQTLASLIVTATPSARTGFHAIAQEMRALLALAIRIQTRRHFSRTRF
jgi:hypothetical protein